MLSLDTVPTVEVKSERSPVASVPGSMYLIEGI